MGVLGFAAAAGVALVAALLATGASAAAGLKVLAPPDGAVLASPQATLIVSGAAGPLEATLNGRKLGGVRQVGTAFTGQLELSAGKNVLLIRSGPDSRQVSVEVRPKDPASGSYQYHDPVAGAECKACHPQGVGRTSPVTEVKLCETCHDTKTGFKYLHGPLGAGQCTICHDPHGSAHPGFLVADTNTLCGQCHAQSGSRQHIERASNKRCPECHDPHGSEKQYLLF